MSSLRHLFVLVMLALSVVVTAVACDPPASALYTPVIVNEYELTFSEGLDQGSRTPQGLIEMLQLKDEDGNDVYAVFAKRPPEEMSTAPTVIYHHDAVGNIETYWDNVGVLWGFGANVLIYDYPGYGKTPGKPAEGPNTKAGRAALAYVRSRQLDQERVFHYGYGLGGAIAVTLAAEQPCRGLILESTFTTLRDLIDEALVYSPASFGSEDRYDSIGKIAAAAKNSTFGVLVFHATRDEFIPPHHGRELFDAIGLVAPKELVFLDTTHEELTGTDRWSSKVATLVNS